MTIYRDGKEFELTSSERFQAHKEYELDCMIEDVKSQHEQGEYDVDLTEEQFKEIAILALNSVSKNDGYFESYWMSVNYTLDDYINNLSIKEGNEE